jgi:membrane protein DedA with SNARE-associated domain
MFDWITAVISESGYLGILLLMLAENVFPPIPSELIMPLAGFVSAQGNLHPILVVLAGTGGSILGALLWYYVGLWLGKERLCALAARHGRWMTVDDKDVAKAINWFERQGGKAVLIGRLVPAVRTLISVPAGIAGMALGRFLLASTIGTVIWTSALTVAGFILKANYTVVADALDMVSKVLLGLVVLLYLYRVIAGGRLGDQVRQWAQQMHRDIYAILLASRDPQMPWYAKGLALLVAAYAVSPVDLIPDFIPLIGHLDDIILVPLGIWLTVQFIPDNLLGEYRQRAEALTKQPRDWRVGVCFMVIWALVLAFGIRWLMILVTGR